MTRSYRVMTRQSRARITTQASFVRSLPRMARSCGASRSLLHPLRVHTYVSVTNTIIYSSHELGHLSIRVAPLRMGSRRAAPGSQILSDFEVISCPWRAASADQGSLYGPLFEKETQRFFCSNLVRIEILLCPRDFLVSRFEQINLWVSFSKEVHIGCPDPQRLPFKGSLLLQNLVDW